MATYAYFGIMLAMFVVVLVFDRFAHNAIVNEAKEEARRETFKIAANIARDHGDFELYDTEGASGQRLERARMAHKIQLEILSRIPQ